MSSTINWKTISSNSMKENSNVIQERERIVYRIEIKKKVLWTESPGYIYFTLHDTHNLGCHVTINR